MAAACLEGDALARIDTPAVLVDLDRLDANIERMASFMRARGIALRPHAKTHKSLDTNGDPISASAGHGSATRDVRIGRSTAERSGRGRAGTI